jgi:hypothetical protein
VSNVTETLDVNPPREDHAPKRVRALVPTAALFVWVFELAAGLVVAMPLHSWARSYFGAHPDGDALVFRPGGHALLSWLGDGAPALPIVLRTTLVLLAVFGIAGRWVFGFVIAWLASHGRRAASTAGRAFVPLVVTAALASAAEVFVASIGLLASSAASSAVEGRLGDARAVYVRVAVLVLFAAPLATLHVFADLNDTALVLTEPAPLLVRMRLAAVTAYRAFGLRMILAWSWRFAAGLVLIVLGSFAGDLVGGRGGAVLALLLLVHQALVLARAALRTDWLERARRAVQRSAL